MHTPADWTPVSIWLTPLVFWMFVIVSWALRPADRRLSGLSYGAGYRG
jgi:hypothetical protein